MTRKNAKASDRSAHDSRLTTHDFLTATDFFKFLTCPHWPYFDRFATAAEKKLKRELTEGEKKRLDDGYLHEREVIAEIMGKKEIAEMSVGGDPKALFEATREQMEKGAPLIYQGTLLNGDWLGRPDLLVRFDGASKLGNWHYRPLDVKSAHELKPIHRMELIFYSLLLERIQGTMPEQAGIINRDHEEHWFEPSGELQKFSEVLEALDRLRKKEKPDPVVRKACFDTGPWGEACLAIAKKTNDIALLYNVDVRKLRALRDLGVKTVADAAVMDIDSYAGAAPGLTAHALASIKTQAESLARGIVIVKDRVDIPTAPCEIYFDIESDLPNDVDYLYGFLVRDADGERYLPILAEKPEDEKKMWTAFLAWLKTLPAEYVVYHYAAYETTRLDLLTDRYGGSAELDLFISRMVDLKPYATKHVAYPLYFYGLKYICKFLGFHWRGDIKTGGESIDWYENWCTTGNRALLDEVIEYNEDDDRATAFLKDWLVRYAAEPGAYEKPYPWT
jgi:predicted RecB family nuclease